MSTTAVNAYPLCYGNEEEFMLRMPVGSRGADREASSNELRAVLSAYKRKAEAPEDPTTQPLLYDGPYVTANGLQPGEFNTGGYREYVDENRIERSSPECATIEELLARIRGNERFIGNVAAWAIKLGFTAGPMRIHRRVFNEDGTTNGCHDGIGLEWPNGQAPSDVLCERVRHMVAACILTRPFMIGVGYYDRQGFAFSQKAARLAGVTGKTSLWDYVLRIQRSKGMARLETRVNDINLSDAATAMRMGSVAIPSAIAHSDAVSMFFEEQISRILPKGSITTQAVHKFNRPALNEDCEFIPGKHNAALARAVRLWQGMAEVFASNMMRHHAGEQPAELLAIAERIYHYCETMHKVLRGEINYSELSDKSDWAAKHMPIATRLAAERNAKNIRWMGDKECRAEDLAYDRMEVSLDASGKPIVEMQGYGYALSDKGWFRDTVPANQVTQAFYEPPLTRASLRAMLIRLYQLNACDWHESKVESSLGGTTFDAQIRTDDPRTTLLTQYQLNLLAGAHRARRV